MKDDKNLNNLNWHNLQIIRIGLDRYKVQVKKTLSKIENDKKQKRFTKELKRVKNTRKKVDDQIKEYEKKGVKNEN